ncbi:MAG: tetratricopeptide repeat protein [Bacteroidia bacterium]|nr:tetratricopeptide repeat protein [Bacteroidia bacterium]
MSFFVSVQVSAQKKDKWLRRNWNNMVSRYNVYFHAQKKLNETIEDLVLLHKDDFSKPIQVFPYGDDATATSIKPKMEEVMKKASFVIDKRGRSKWVDDCYLLIGKSHFFGGDYFSADEAFQFVNSQYIDKPINYEAKLWILKTLAKQGKYEDAEAVYKTFIREEKFPPKINNQLYLTIGDIYTRLGYYDDAQKNLEAGLKKTKNKVLKYRIHFLLGQLYFITGDYKKSAFHYSKVARSSAPYEFAFQSNIQIVKANSLSGNSSTRESRKNLKKMLRDDKNIDYFSQLYYELGNLDYADKNYNKSIKNYQNAVKYAKGNNVIKTDAFLKIAKIYYENRNYKMAQKFFDSTALVIPETHPEYEKIKLQQANLTNLIDQLLAIKNYDSLLHLSSLSKEQLYREINRIIDNKNAEAKKKAKKKAKDENPTPPDILNTTPGPSGPIAGTNQFIFDNPTLMGTEYNEFIKRWGNRKLTDNWRISSSKKNNEPDPETKENYDNNDGKISPENQKTKESRDDEFKRLLANVPLTEKDKSLAHSKILTGHVEAGKIYFEKLKEYNEAISHFDAALQLYPANKYEAEILYYLSKCYSSLKDSSKSNYYTDLLNNKYPDSEFNKVFKNNYKTNTDTIAKPKENAINEKQEVTELYQKMYNAYQAKNYELVKAIKTEADKKYAGNAIQAKFDYLYALTIAQTESIEKFAELLKQIKESYPGTEIAEIAQYTLEVIDNRNKAAKLDPKSIYKYDASSSHFFSIVTPEGQSEKLKNAISNFNTKFFSTKNLKIKSYLLGNKDMLGVELFENKSTALEYYKSFSINFKEFMSPMPSEAKFFVISSENFLTLIREMNDAEYISFFEKMYF